MAKSKRLTTRDFTPARVDLTHRVRANPLHRLGRAGFDSYGYPDAVPVLDAVDIHRGKYFKRKDSKTGPACLLGHGMRAFSSPYAVPLPVREALRAQIDTLCGGGGIAMFNDNKATPALAARVWNAAMASLGYTEGNPEAKNVAVKDE